MISSKSPPETLLRPLLPLSCKLHKLPAIVSRNWFQFTVTLYMHAREREKKKRERASGARERGAVPGQREKTRNERIQKAACAAPRRRRPAGTRTEEEKSNSGRPQEKTGGRKGGMRREEEPDPETAVPKSRKRRKKIPVSHKSIQKRAPRTTQEHLQHKKRSSCPKTLFETIRNKRATPKNKAKKGRTFLSPFSGRKKGHFWAQKSLPQRPRDSHSKARCEKPSEKKIRQTEL